MGIYLFKNIEGCENLKKRMSSDLDSFVKKGTSLNGVEYYLILDWIMSLDGTKGVGTGWLDSKGYRYVKNISELPESAGVYVTSYGGRTEDIEYLKSGNIPLIEKICPWVNLLIKEILSFASCEQGIVMIDKDHMVYNNYKSIFPEDTIIVDELNYKEEIKKFDNGKPKHFVVYNTFRPIEAERVIEYIKHIHPDKEHVFQTKTICGWTLRAGLFEEIRTAVDKHSLDEIWVIAGGKKNRSLLSIINETRETSIDYSVISDLADIKMPYERSKNIGVLKAPVPYEKADEILNYILKSDSSLLSD